MSSRQENSSLWSELLIFAIKLPGVNTRQTIHTQRERVSRLLSLIRRLPLAARNKKFL